MKGENVLIFGANTAKIADFGLSFLSELGGDRDREAHVDRRMMLEDSVLSTPLSKSLSKLLQGRSDFSPEGKKALASSRVGTVWIRAPEVDSDQRYDTASVDIFSLGMIFAEFLTNGEAEDIRLSLIHI